MKATKAKAKPQNPQKVQKRLAVIEFDLNSVERDATNAFDFNDSDSSLNSEKLALESNKKKGRPRGSKDKGILILALIFITVKIIITYLW